MTHNVCPACGSARSRRGPQVRSFRFRRCRVCRTLWIPDPPPPEQLSRLYGDERYFENPDFGDAAGGSYHGYLGYLDDREHIEAKFAEVLEHVETQVSPGALLDVGAGPGFMVAAARQRGWSATGMDLNPWAVRMARENLGLDVREGSLPDPAIESGSLDTVTMMDLLEHVPDPATLVAEAARITRPGGMLAVLTPDAGSPVSRMLGRRWPEVIRVPEHLVLFSAEGLGSLLERHGFTPIGWHSIGKRSSLKTLLADVAPIAPGPLGALERRAKRSALATRTFELDPHTKFCLYARRVASPVAEVAAPRAPRLPKRAYGASDETVLQDLHALAAADRLTDWMSDQFATLVRGNVAEVGAGIGTFSERLLAAGAERLMLLEPHRGCIETLEQRFGSDGRVSIERESVPNSRALTVGAESFDLVLCQNVLEHVGDDEAAAREMANALRPGGDLVLLVPAHPRLYSSLDAAYGHCRRYTANRLEEVIDSAGLELQWKRSFNTLGIPGWWLSGKLRRPSISPGSLRIYNALVSVARPLEDALRPPWGLSLIAVAHKAA